MRGSARNLTVSGANGDLIGNQASICVDAIAIAIVRIRPEVAIYNKLII